MSQTTTSFEIGTGKICDTDQKLAGIINRIGPCLLARREEGFSALAYSIIGQQLSKSAASSIRSKFDSLFNGHGADPLELINIADDELRQTGLSLPKINYLKGLADYVIAGNIDFDSLQDLDDESIISMLTEIKGIGRWTAEMYLMFSMNRLDVFPVGDRAVRTAISSIYNIPKNSSDAVYIQIASKWAPYRTIASWYLYKYLEISRDKKS